MMNIFIGHVIKNSSLQATSRYYPDGRVVSKNASLEENFYIWRNAPQVIWLNRRGKANPLAPTGSYCCEIPTLGGERTLCPRIKRFERL